MRQIIYVFGLILAVFIANQFIYSPAPNTHDGPQNLAWFEGESTRGSAFNNHDFKDHWTLVYFGYASCPDLCPTTIGMIKQAFESLNTSGPKLDNLRFAFFSVDPERDSLEKLTSYLHHFDNGFIGVRGSLNSWQAFFNSLNIAKKVGREAKPTDYLVYHPTNLFLIDPKGRWIDTLEEPFSVESIKGLLVSRYLNTSP